MFKKGTKWIVGRDSSLSLWHDKWMDKDPLRVLIAGSLNHEEDGVLLKEVVNF